MAVGRGGHMPNQTAQGSTLGEHHAMLISRLRFSQVDLVWAQPLCYTHVNLHRHVPCQSYPFTSPPPPTFYCCARLCSHEQEYQALLAFYTESMWGAANMRSLFILGLTSLYDFSGGYLDRISYIGKWSSLISFCLKPNVLLISC